MALGLQLDLIPQAKAVGVKLFVPAEYGIYQNMGPSTHKTAVRSALKSIDLPYTLFFPGYFADLAHMFLGYNYTDGRMRIVGDGNTAFSLTSRQDIGRFVAHVLTTAALLVWRGLSCRSKPTARRRWRSRSLPRRS